MQLIAQFRLLGIRRRHPNATHADQPIVRLQEHCQLKFTARLFVLPTDEILHQPFHILPQEVGPGSILQGVGIRLIRRDSVPIMCQKLP